MKPVYLVVYICGIRAIPYSQMSASEYQFTKCSPFVLNHTRSGWGSKVALLDVDSGQAFPRQLLTNPPAALYTIYLL